MHQRILILLLASASCLFGQGFTLKNPGFVAALDKASVATSSDPAGVAGLIRWYDAQSAGFNEGDQVSTWTDKKGNANFTEVSAGTGPTNRTSVSQFGNKPAIQFNSRLLRSAALTNEVRTIFIVYMRTNNSAGSYYATWAGIEFYSSTDNDTFYSGPFTVLPGGNCSVAGVGVLKWTSLSSFGIRGKSGAYATGDPTDTYVNQYFELGGENGTPVGNCFIGEILVYDSALSDANVNLIGAYLAPRWNFTWTDL